LPLLTAFPTICRRLLVLFLPLVGITDMMKGNYITFISVNNGDISAAASREEFSSDESNVRAVTAFCERVVADIVEIVLDGFNRSFDSLQDYVDTYERVAEVVNYHQVVAHPMIRRGWCFVIRRMGSSSRLI